MHTPEFCDLNSITDLPWQIGRNGELLGRLMLGQREVHILSIYVQSQHIGEISLIPTDNSNWPNFNLASERNN